jgi:hypothetical protein
VEGFGDENGIDRCVRDGKRLGCARQQRRTGTTRTEPRAHVRVRFQRAPARAHRWPDPRSLCVPNDVHRRLKLAQKLIGGPLKATFGAVVDVLPKAFDDLLAAAAQSRQAE